MCSAWSTDTEWSKKAATVPNNSNRVLKLPIKVEFELNVKEAQEYYKAVLNILWVI